MTDYCGDMKFYCVPFTEIQEELKRRCPEEYFTILMRRLMMLIAQEIAKKDGALALITGEGVGQVASQTMEAIAATNEVVKMPILRPLIGLDKQATCDISRDIGAFETSILPYEDCCTVFVAKHPKTHPHPEDIIEAEKDLDIEMLVESGVAGTEDIVINPFD
jgi:thiamine biosynthesis protein ThiI